MRSILLLLIAFLFFSSTTPAQSIVRFKISRPYAVFSFLEVASGGQAQSSTYIKYVDTAIVRRDTGFAAIARSFRQLMLSYNYRRDEYPSHRRQTRSTYDLLVIAAVRSATLNEFRVNTIGILPNSTHERLCSLLIKAEPYYERFVWRLSEKSVKEQIAGFGQYSTRANELFRSFRIFYNSSWPDDIPFDVAIFPIPARNGTTTATPHANSLCVSVLTGASDYAGSMGVTMHEICHVLYDEQTSGFQHELNDVFQNSKSPFKSIAYSFFDEALATALGNGWGYQYFSGKEDTSSWYNNEYINGFAHALYPLVKEYLTAGRSIDSLFIERSIDLFGKTYPRSVADYSILLNNMFLYSDAEAPVDRQDLRNMVAQYFQSSRYNFSSPILHEYSIGSMRSAKETQLIIIDRNQDSTLTELKKVMPELNKVLHDQLPQNYIASFYDDSQRAIILIRVTGKEMLKRALFLLKQKQYLDTQRAILPVE